MLTSSIADQLGQIDCSVVFDQAIYAKAQQIIWQNPVEFQRIVLRLGAFHTACTLLSILGKRFGNAGLADVVVESRVTGSGSVQVLLEGRYFNGAVRVRKLVSESLEQLCWVSFGTWIKTQEQITVDKQARLDCIKAIRDAQCLLSFQNLLSHLVFQQFLELCDDYYSIP